MVRILILLSLVTVLYGPCSKKRPQTQPFPTPVPTVQPTPEPTVEPTPEVTPTPEAQPTPLPSPSPSPSPSATPLAQATPYPTPNLDPSAYIPSVTPGKTVTVSGDNLADKIQAAQDDPEVGTVRLEGGGSITKRVFLKKHTVFVSGEYACDLPADTTLDWGCFLISNGVHVEGPWKPPQALLDYFKFGNGGNHKDPYLLKVQALTAGELAGNSGVKILEPTFENGPYIGIITFQAATDQLGSHVGLAKNIAITGIHIKGRQARYDGGVRSSILLGNCRDCTVQNNYLEGVASIGITFGGSALEHNNFSDRGLIWHNITSETPAANIAIINSENLIVAENYTRRPGKRNPAIGGGTCAADIETNTNEDHTKNIWIINNLADYNDAAFDSIGNAFCLQDPYLGPNHGKVIAANNIAIGGRTEGRSYMTSGIFMVGLKQCEIINNYIFRTGQNALNGFAMDGCLVQDNDFESTGGGGNFTVRLEGINNSILRRNNYRDREGFTGNTQAGFLVICEKNNVYEQNLTNGVDRPNVKSEPCAVSDSPARRQIRRPKMSGVFGVGRPFPK